MSEAETRARMVRAARAMIGRPWRHQGRSATGVDCVGLVILAAREAGFTVADVTGYDRRALGAGFLEHFRARMATRPVAEAEPGDVLVFTETLYPCHCGVAGLAEAARGGGLTVIHAHALRRVALEEPLSGDPARRLAFVFRLPVEEIA